MTLIVMAMAASVALAGSGTTPLPLFETNLVPPAQSSSDELGRSVAFQEPFMVAGAWTSSSKGVLRHGAGEIWRLAPEGWIHEASVTPPDPEVDLRFGGAVAVARPKIQFATRTPAAFGADGATVGGKMNAGAVYIFRRFMDRTWPFETKLVASDAAAGDRFGRAVAMDGDLVAVGAPLRQSSRGAIYLFRLVAKADKTFEWQQEAILTANDAAIGDALGTSVAVSGDTVIAGAVGKHAGSQLHQGAVYVFTRSGGTWSQKAKIVASDGQAGDGFGRAVAFDPADETIAGSTTHLLTGGLTRVHLFERSGPTWVQKATLTPPAPQANEQFGSTLALRSGRLVAGAPNRSIDGSAGRGAIVQFLRHETTGTWALDQVIIDPVGAAGDAFGTSVALHGEAMVVGARGVDQPGEANVGAVLVYWAEDCNLNDAFGLCTIVPADVNQDSFVDCYDLALLLGHWGEVEPGDPLDLDGDGRVDGVDLAILLGLWTG
ncbi:MAG: hypothetical protein KF724_13505 [Phycisphaeraceae bacterium]|nr:hypothetical protein [Phycisphaeraceae bacterium]